MTVPRRYLDRMSANDGRETLQAVRERDSADLETSPPHGDYGSDLNAPQLLAAVAAVRPLQSTRSEASRVECMTPSHTKSAAVHFLGTPLLFQGQNLQRLATRAESVKPGEWRS